MSTPRDPGRTGTASFLWDFAVGMCGKNWLPPRDELGKQAIQESIIKRIVGHYRTSEETWG
jgi:hypothetical protein